MDGLAICQTCRKEPPIPSACHETPTVAGEFIGKVLTVTRTGDMGSGVMREIPGGEGDRGAMGFELPRREIDDQAPNLASATGFEFGRNQLEMWRPQQFSLRVQLVERPFDKAHQIAAQDNRIIGGHLSIS